MPNKIGGNFKWAWTTHNILPSGVTILINSSGNDSSYCSMLDAKTNASSRESAKL